MLCPATYCVKLLHSPEAIQAQLFYGEGATFLLQEVLPDQRTDVRTRYSKSREAELYQHLQIEETIFV